MHTYLEDNYDLQAIPPILVTNAFLKLRVTVVVRKAWLHVEYHKKQMNE